MKKLQLCIYFRYSQPVCKKVLVCLEAGSSILTYLLLLLPVISQTSHPQIHPSTNIILPTNLFLLKTVLTK